MSIRPDSFFKYKNGKLFVEDLDLKVLEKKWGTPLYVYSQAAIERPIKEMRNALGTHPHLVCFAVKSNSNPSLLRFLSEQGVGADVVSGGELEIARRSGISAQKIVFSGVGKTRDEIRFALRQNIYSFQIESTDEWELLHSLAKTKVRYALRINPDVSAKTHPYISTGLKESKFGISLKEVRTLLILTKNNRAAYLGGLSIHIGSQITSLTPFREAFLFLKKQVAATEKTLGRKLDFVDLGGGLGVPYHSEKIPAIARWLGLAKAAFPSHRLLFEPGRLITANAGILLTNVIRTKPGFIVVDAAMNDLLRPSLYKSVHRVLPYLKHHVSNSSASKAKLVGPVCESSDVLSHNPQLSTQMKEGDSVAILSAGAYGMSMTSNYNSRTRPAEVFVSGKKMTLIRRRETLKDLLRTLT